MSEEPPTSHYIPFTPLFDGVRKPVSSSSHKKSQKTSCALGCHPMRSIDEFLLQEGFFQGFCSDFTIKAFDKEYHLHRLLLGRAGYFRTLFSGKWSDHNSKYHELIFDNNDNVTKESFELAIGYLYGGVNTIIEKKFAINMISTGQFLDIPELVCKAIENINEEMTLDNIPEFTRFANDSNLGPPSEKILENARSLLCIEGWENGVKKWDGIPVKLIIDVVSSDSFFVSTEWDRCIFIIKLVERRINDFYGLDKKFKKLNIRCKDHKLRSSKSMNWFVAGSKKEHKTTMRNRSSSINVLSESDSSYEEEDDKNDKDSISEEDIHQLKECLNKSVYFSHLSFEQLQYLETLKDINNEPYVNPSVLKDALWSQSILHKLVITSPKSSQRLNITEVRPDNPNNEQTHWYRVPVKDETAYGSPTTIDKIINEKQVILKTVNDGSTPGSSETVNPEEEPYDNDLKNNDAEEEECSKDSDRNDIDTNNGASRIILKNYLNNNKKSDTKTLYKWTKFQPFRFSVAFSKISELDSQKRLYGKVLWYAGCYWNLYIQKIRKNKRFQLGVYLHRSSNSGPPRNGIVNPDLFENYDVVNGINLKERLTKNDIATATNTDSLSPTIQITEDDVMNSSTFESLGFNAHDDSALSFTSEVTNDFNNQAHSRSSSSSSSTNLQPVPGNNSNPIEESMSNYQDERKDISVYFVIRTPSEKVKSNLICFTSSPSDFTISQSWGWKSNSMCAFNEDGTLVTNDEKCLKFMVTLGNI